MRLTENTFASVDRRSTLNICCKLNSVMKTTNWLVDLMLLVILSIRMTIVETPLVVVVCWEFVLVVVIVMVMVVELLLLPVVVVTFVAGRSCRWL